jgi:hypothetical protein
MALDQSQPRPNQHRQTWPFRGRHAVLNGNTNDKIDRKINYDSELDLTRHESIKSIFMTDSSKTLQISERNIFRDPTTTSMNTG